MLLIPFKACPQVQGLLKYNGYSFPIFSGEWPWVAMLFTDKDEYLGAGAYVAKVSVA